MKHLLKTKLFLLAQLVSIASISADYDYFEVDHIWYMSIGTNVSVMCPSSGCPDNLTIPSTVTWNDTVYTVTSIEHDAFWGSTLTSVSIPNTVSYVGQSAFAGCDSLRSIIVSGMNTIYDSRDNCNAIIETSTNTLIVGCQNTIIPNSVSVIDNEAFAHCRELSSISIPNSVTTIGPNAFAGCENLINISIPNSVLYISYGAFYNTAWYNNQPDGLVYAGKVAYKYKGDMPNEISIVLKEGTVSIAENAFYGCSGVMSITIPSSIITIGPQAFAGCQAVTNVIVANDNMKYDSRQNCNAIIETATNTLIVGFKNSTIPNSVTTIGGSAFGGCRGLTSINIPNSVTEIGHGAFQASGLTSINIPNSVTTIGDAAFNYCSNLASVTIPNSVTTIGKWAFRNCKLTSVFCYVLNPTTLLIGNEPFIIEYSSNNYSSRKLHVPVGTVAAYQADTNWNRYFGSIVEMDPMVTTSIELDRSAAVMTIGESLQLTATLQPIEAIYNEVAWASSNPDVATVDGNGHVTAVNVGTATITAMTTDGSNLSASCQVTVRNLSSTECFAIEDTTVMHGETFVIPVAMVNDASVIAFQTDIFLPEGLEIVKEDGEYVIDPSERMTRTHTIMSDEVSNGAVRVLCYSSNYKPFTGESGDDLFFITVKAADDAAGDYTISLKNTLLTNTDFVDIAAPDVAANVHVLAYLLGDANNSGKVTVTDVVVTAQYVLERNPEPFVFDAADVNTDGNITVADVSRIAWMVLNENAAELSLLRAPALRGVSDRLNGEGFTLQTGQTRTVSITLDNALDYSAFQLDLMLPEGLVASNFALTDRAGNHAFDMNTLGNGATRVLCYSPSVASITGHDGALLTFDVTATSPVTGDITVDGIELVTTACQTVRLDAFAIGVNTVTAVNELNAKKFVECVEYYNLAGQRLEQPVGGVTLVVTTYSDGTRTTTKLIK